MEVPGVAIFKPQLPGQASASFRPELAAKASRGRLIQLGDVVNRVSIPGEDLLDLLAKPGR